LIECNKYKPPHFARAGSLFYAASGPVRLAAGAFAECGEQDGCYGCLRNYRNQFAHQHLKRGPVMSYLKTVLETL
jgi:hypothetical protein